jgi:hypothetical protein
MAGEKAFLGRGWSFPPTFDKKIKGLAMSEAEEDIRKGRTTSAEEARERFGTSDE